ncbi:Probable cytochrome P450 6a13 [Gryllus bimaculatus]|nr:Probable cytochrome P450 6a13 [Gryllus bimaculatus]
MGVPVLGVAVAAVAVAFALLYWYFTATFDYWRRKGVQSLGARAARAEQVEMKEPLAQYATDVIGNCAFGLQINSLSDPDCEFRRMGKKMFEPTLASALRRFTLIFLPTLAKVLNVSLIGGDVTRFFRAAVRETVALRERHGVLRHDFLHLLLQLRAHGADDAFELTDNLLAAQVFVFFMAGFETTSTTMSFALHELAVNPDVQARLQEEVDAALQETDGRVTYDAVMKMEIALCIEYSMQPVSLGMRFGLLQAKTGLAALLARYSFEACERTQEPPRLDPKALVTAAEGGAWLRVRARCPSAAP